MSDSPDNNQDPASNARNLINAYIPATKSTGARPTTTPTGTPPQVRSLTIAGPVDNAPPPPTVGAPVLYGRVPGYQAANAYLPKRKPTATVDDLDSNNDHDMRGKDVPTVFKRRRNAREDPVGHPSSLEEPRFAPMYPNIVMFDGGSLYPGGAGVPALAMAAFPPFLQSGQAGGSSGQQVRRMQVDRSTVPVSPSRALRVGTSPRRQATPGRRLQTRRRKRTIGGDDSDETDDNEDDEDEEAVYAHLNSDNGIDLQQLTSALRARPAGGKPKSTRKRRNVETIQEAMDEDEQEDETCPPANQTPDKGKGRAEPRFSEVDASHQNQAPYASTSNTSRPHTYRRASEIDVEDDNNGARRASTSGQRRADGTTNAGAPPSGPSSHMNFVDIQHSLRQLNNNMGRLVTLVSEQTQFFSTMQARGFPSRPRSASPSQPDAASSSRRKGQVDPASLVKLRRRVARDPEPTNLPTSRDPDINTLAAHIRQVTRDLMGRQSIRSPFHPDHMASDTEAETYDPADGPACTVEHFRPDLAATPTTDYNASVVDVFVRHYRRLNPEANEKLVRRLFVGHLKYLCARYKECLDGVQAIRRRQLADNRAERQRNLWIRRLSVAALYPDLQQHIPILRALGPFGMSSDEEDHRPNGEIRYTILKKLWRNPALTPWLRLFDQLHRISRLGSMSGAHAHVRMASNHASMRRPPVRGLPVTAYNPRWLASLEDHDRMLLAVRMDEEYDFTHSAELQAKAMGAP